METLGKYALLEQLSSAETSDIFFAKPIGSEGSSDGLIVKRLKPLVAEDSDYIKAFLDAAKLSAQLEHQTICGISDFGSIDGHHFLARQYAPGKDLRNLARRHSIQRRLVPQPVTLFLIKQLCDGLEYAHKSMVHGSLSPNDILIGFSGEVKVINFGMGAYWARRASAKGAIPKDKLNYLTPDHVTNGKIDKRTDVFSLGLLFYELLTGNQVFAEGLDPAKLDQIKKSITPPSGVRPSISGDLDKVVMRALDFDPEKRYGSLAELKKQIDSIDGLEVGSQEDTAALMNRIFPNESIIEKERANLVVPAGLAQSSDKKAAAPVSAKPVAVAPIVASPPQRDVPMSAPIHGEEEEKKPMGLWIGVAVGVVILAAVGIYFGMSSSEPKPQDTVSLNTTETKPEVKQEPVEVPVKKAEPVNPEVKPASTTPATKTAAGTASTDSTDTTDTGDTDATDTDPSMNGQAKSKNNKYRPRPRPRPRPTPKVVSRPDPVPEPTPTIAPKPKPKLEPKPMPATVEPDWTKPKPANPAPSQAESGFLKVVTSTPVDVVVDGWKASVKGGQLNMKLSVGPHNVKVIFKESDKEFTKQIVIKAGKTKTLRLVRSQ